MAREINVKLQNARDVKLNWEQNNRVLLDGEIGVVFDATDDPKQVKLKIGNGSNDFNSLPYFEDPWKVSKSEVGVPNGVASLDENGLIPLEQLPDSFGNPSTTTTYIDKVPEQLGTLVYNGGAQMPVWRYYDPDIFIIGGEITGTNAGEYTITFQPVDGYAWADGTRGPVMCTWNIQRQSIEVKPSLESDELIFCGESIAPTVVDCDSSQIVVGGNSSATIVGSYVIIFAPDTNHCWQDGSTTPWAIGWAIRPCVRAFPTPKQQLTYTGSELTLSWNNFPAVGVSISGTTRSSNAGTHIASFALEEGYSWEDGTTDSINVEWVIKPKKISKPEWDGTLVYNGNLQVPDWVNLAAQGLAISGDTSGLHAASYTTIFTPMDNYEWEDGGRTPLSLTWRIEQQVIDSIPSVSGELVYNGQPQVPVWRNNPPGVYNVTEAPAVDVGRYETVFELTSDYRWSASVLASLA